MSQKTFNIKLLFWLLQETYINSKINENHFLRKASVFNDIFQFIKQELDKANSMPFNIHLHLPLGIIRKS